MKIDHTSDPVTRRRKFATKEKWARAAIVRDAMSDEDIAHEEARLRAEIEARVAAGDVTKDAA